jgi:hypothetical protein
MRKLTQEEMLELICDIAYQQSSRELSGSDWFAEFLEKINRWTKEP